MTILVFRRKGANSSDTALHDSVLEAGGITINQDNYDASLDRIYDVKGLANIHTEIENTGGSNGLTYTIQNARKDFLEVSELVDADFDETILADTNVSFGTTDLQDIIDVSPETTGIRIRVRRQTASNDTTMAGIVSAN